MACIGCSASAVPVDVVVLGIAAAAAGVTPGSTLLSADLCRTCLAKCDGELARLHREHRRLRARLRTREFASAMMCRRVERYFRNGTLRPLRAAENG
jgi:hypothetical protein